MPSYVVTGASRGIGYEFIRQLSSVSNNIVVGLVRNKAQVDEKIAKDGLKNITILEADIVDLSALKRAAEAVKQLTGGSLDYLINNAAAISELSSFATLGDFDSDPTALEQDLLNSFTVNVIGVVKTINVFLPLTQKSSTKKVITISSGMADVDLVNKFSVDNAAPYSISKTAVNMAVAKYNALYGKDGILFMAISPGVVETRTKPTPPNEKAMEQAKKFIAYAPHFKGPITPEESVRMMMDVIEKASVENGDGGAFVSHFGNKQWI